MVRELGVFTKEPDNDNSPNVNKGKLNGVARMHQSCRFIRAKAYALRWTQSNRDWILANNSNGAKVVEVIVHAFKQDSNDGCIYVTTQNAANWIASNLPGFEGYAKRSCFLPGYPNNEARATVTLPVTIGVNTKYYAQFWWHDNSDPDLAELPLAFGWQNYPARTNAASDDNVKKFCFGADDGRSWGPYVFGGACKPAAPVLLYRYPDFLGDPEGFSGKDDYLANNPIGDNMALSIRLVAGWVATLFSEPGYQGVSSTFNADDPDLQNNTVGTSTSSIQTTATGVAVYTNYDFGSSPYIFSGCDPNLSDNAIGDNTISSVRVPPGWKLILYDGYNYTTPKLVLQGVNVNNLANRKNFDNRASSLCVKSPQEQEAQAELGDWTGDE